MDAKERGMNITKTIPAIIVFVAVAVITGCSSTSETIRRELHQEAVLVEDAYLLKSSDIALVVKQQCEEERLRCFDSAAIPLGDVVLIRRERFLWLMQFLGVEVDPDAEAEIEAAKGEDK